LRASGNTGHGSESVDSCAIIVTEANELTKEIHDRMPVILAAEAYNFWMDPDLIDPERLKAFLKPYPSERMMAYGVSTQFQQQNSPYRPCRSRDDLEAIFEQRRSDPEKK
jgi:putative SOS response-associated peptidase YedK